MAIKQDHYKKLSGHKKINIIPITDRLKTEQKNPAYSKVIIVFLREYVKYPKALVREWNLTQH